MEKLLNRANMDSVVRLKAIQHDGTGAQLVLDHLDASFLLNVLVSIAQHGE